MTPITSTLETLYLHCTKHLPEGLIQGESINRHRNIARLFPIYFFNSIGFETRLDVPGLDDGLYLGVNPGLRSWDFLVGNRRDDSSTIFHHPVWKRIRRFFQVATDPKTPINSRMNDVWFEFDAEAKNPSIPDLFFPAHIGTGGSQDLEKLAQSAEQFLLETDNFIKDPFLTDCIAAIPKDCKLQYYAFMLARDWPGIRLIIRCPNQLDLVSQYLERISWPGSMAESLSEINWIEGSSDYFYLHIDIAEQVAPRIGIELKLRRNETLSVDIHRMTTILDRLQMQGLCHSRKRDALLAVPGATRETMGFWFVLLRRISNAKIVLQPGKPLQAKAYFQFFPVWGA